MYSINHTSAPIASLMLMLLGILLILSGVKKLI